MIELVLRRCCPRCRGDRFKEVLSPLPRRSLLCRAATSSAGQPNQLLLVSYTALAALDEITLFGGGVAEAVLLRRRYAVMKEAARARR